jgi:hypothetical protein
MDSDEAAKAILSGKVDAVFLMGDSVSTDIIRQILHTDGIRLFDFTQADAYTRRIAYLNKITLPKGSIDFGKGTPAHDFSLLAPTVELIEQEIRISNDANRFYKSGKSSFYRYLPFWLASLVSRIVVVLVPMIVLLLPGMRLIPAIYRWRFRSRITRWYRALLVIERDILSQLAPDKRKELLKKLYDIEAEVNRMKVPASFADQFYHLRGHITFVHTRLLSESHPH